MFYQEPLYRPPSEANSAILQVAFGCPHNSCAFCGMYKARKYYQRPLSAVFDQIQSLPQIYTQANRVFLADGDVFHLPVEHLEQILIELNRVMTALRRVSTYANGSSILAKPLSQLKKLANHGLTQFYMGLESGDDNILQRMKKGETAEGMVKAVQRAKLAGIRSSVMVLVGLAEYRGSKAHAISTAEALNEMQPDFLSLLTVIPEPRTLLHHWSKSGDFIPLTPFQCLMEIHQLISRLRLERCIFRCNHVSNDIHLAGRFPRDKSKLLSEIEFYLEGLS